MMYSSGNIGLVHVPLIWFDNNTDMQLSFEKTFKKVAYWYLYPLYAICGNMPFFFPFVFLFFRWIMHLHACNTCIHMVKSFGEEKKWGVTSNSWRRSPYDHPSPRWWAIWKSKVYRSKNFKSSNHNPSMTTTIIIKALSQLYWSGVGYTNFVSPFRSIFS